ncbi:MAG: hypothetical protein CEN90_54 [Parcubacteria group bacterium Licking1014_17]|nr:MAG: hypothetical protein CEN90_54 [Parcubacteria group bacterium Licking1014_17]
MNQIVDFIGELLGTSWEALCWLGDHVFRGIRIWLAFLGVAMAVFILLMAGWLTIGSFTGNSSVHAIFLALSTGAISVLLFAFVPLITVLIILTKEIPALGTALRIVAWMITSFCLLAIITSGFSTEHFAGHAITTLMLGGCILVSLIMWLPIEKIGWQFHLVRIGLVITILIVRFGYQERLGARLENVQRHDMQEAKEIKRERLFVPKEYSLESIGDCGKFSWTKTDTDDKGNPTVTYVWYYGKDASGRIGLFEEDGFHPATGKRLEPVDTQVEIDLICKQAEIDRKEADRKAEERTRVKLKIESAKVDAIPPPIPEKQTEETGRAVVSGAITPAVIKLDLDPSLRYSWRIVNLEPGEYTVKAIGQVCSYELETKNICVGPEGMNWTPRDVGRRDMNLFPMPDERFLALIGTLRYDVNGVQAEKSFTLGREAEFSIPENLVAVLEFHLNLPDRSTMSFTKDVLFVIISKQPAEMARGEQN